MTVQTFISYRIPTCLFVLWSLPHLTVNPLGVAAVTQGVDGGPGLSGLVVQTSTSLGLLFPSMFDAMSCSRREMVERNGQNNTEGVIAQVEKNKNSFLKNRSQYFPQLPFILSVTETCANIHTKTEGATSTEWSRCELQFEVTVLKHTGLKTHTCKH